MASTTDVEKRIERIEQELRTKLSKHRIEETEFTMKKPMKFDGDVSFDGSNTFKTLPKFNGNNLVAADTPFLDSFTGSNLRKKYLMSQRGPDFNGNHSIFTDGFGNSVDISADGKVIAIGAKLNDEANVNCGKLFVYEWDESAYTWIERFTLLGTHSNNYLGTSVALSGNGSRLVIGNSGEKSGEGSDEYDNGAAVTYDWNGSTYTQVGQKIFYAVRNLSLGESVSISEAGTRIAIGIPASEDAGFYSGRCETYDFNGSTWDKIGQTIHGDDSGDNAGYDVKLSRDGSTLLVDMKYSDNENNSNSGSISIFTYSNNSWVQKGETLSSEIEYSNFGHSVAISDDGNIVAISGFKESKDNKGGVSVYRFRENKWELMGDIIESEELNFGSDVAMSGNGKVLAINDKTKNSSKGETQFYEFSEGKWIKIGPAEIGDSEYDELGSSLALSKDGSTLILGTKSTQMNSTKHVRVVNLSEYPTIPVDLPKNPPVGTLRYDLASGSVRVYSGSGWVDLNA